MIITDNGNVIELNYGGIPLLKKTLQKNEITLHLFGDHVKVNYKNNIIDIDWRDVSSPTVTSGLSFYITLLGYINNIPTSGLYCKTGSFVDADLVDGTFYGLSTHVLEVNDAIGNEIKTLSITTPAGVTANYTLFAGKMDGTDKPNWFYYDFGASIDAGTWYWTIMAHS